MRRRAATRIAATWEAIAVAAVACLSSVCIAGCTQSTVARGADFYQQGRYIDADQLFEHAEPQLAEYSAQERARYCLYRGLTYQALGDVALAQRWLRYAATLDAHLPTSLPAVEQQLLADTLRTLRRSSARLNTATSGAAVAPGLARGAVQLSR